MISIKTKEPSFSKLKMINDDIFYTPHNNRPSIDLICVIDINYSFTKDKDLKII